MEQSEPDHMQPSAQAIDDELLAWREQVVEIDRFRQADKGKHRVDDHPDHLVASDVFETEARAHITYLSDLKLARKIDRMGTDEYAAWSTRSGDFISESSFIGYRFDDDELSSFEEVSGFGTSSSSTHYTPLLSEEDESDIAGTSTEYRIRREKPIKKPEPEVQCCVCLEDFLSDQIIRLKCAHAYCTGCLKDIFLRATRDPSLFPLRCCREPIPSSLAQKNLCEQEWEKFKNAEIEFTTTDKTYCSNKRCGKFIPPSQITADIALCASCTLSTCTMCKESTHPDDCPDHDASLQATIQLASREAWRRCFSCRAMVQRVHGCNHMLCRCMAEFCYLCGAQWGSCRCSQLY